MRSVRQDPDANGKYLYETRPQFANLGDWTSSDFLFKTLGVDPAPMQKRLGDGYYEQRLVREQMNELTGRAPANGASDDSVYQALLGNAVSAARAFGLRPGIALTAEQVSNLTSDIVWMESQQVKLPDGSIDTVLVPKVYLAHLGDGAVTAGGALVTGGGAGVSINVDGDIVNRGGVIDGGSGRTLLVSGNDILNQGGTIRGGDVLLSAARDVRNESLASTQTYSSANTSGSYTALSNQASIVASGALQMSAGRDITDVAGHISAANASLSAGRDVSFNALTTGSTYTAQVGQDAQNNLTVGHALTQLNTTGDLVVSAGRDLTFNGAQLNIGGNGALLAGRALTVASVMDQVKTDQHGDASAKNYAKQAADNQSVVGSSVSAGGALQLAAGLSEKGTLSVSASNLAGTGALQLSASGDVNIVSVGERHVSDMASKSSSHTLVQKSSSSSADYSASTLAIGSSVSGASVSVVAGNNLNVLGSSLSSTGALALKASGSVTIAAAENTDDESHSREEKKSGLMGSGGVGFSVGTLQQSKGDVSSSTAAASSMVGSTDGNVSITAGKNYTQIGSYVIAPKGDLAISAERVDILEAQTRSSDSSETKVKQTGVTVALTSPVLSAIQTAGQMKSAASQTSDGRMKALAGAVTALSAKNAYDAVAANPGEAGGVNVSVSLGTSKSDSKTMQNSTAAVASSVSAGGNVSINATGGGARSDITIQGSTVKAGGNVTLKADDAIDLLAAKNSAEQTSTNSSSSASVGVSFGTNGLLYTASASGGRGKADGSDVTWTNTHVDAGNTLTLQSGGDTTLKGAVASGAQVGGDLRLESLQDTSIYASAQKSLGGSVSVGAGVVSGSVNVSNSKMQSDFASVKEQSGIKAGDGGFQLTVGGNTNLVGAVITSTDGAVAADKNALSTATLTQSNLQNRANYTAQSVSLGGGYSSGGASVGKDQQGNAVTGGAQTPGSTLPSLNGFSATTPVAMAASGNASSVTQSGISGGKVAITESAAQLALTGKTATQTLADVKRDVATGKDGSNALAPIFNKQEIEAGFAVVSALTREVGTFLETRAKEVDAKKAAADKVEQAAQDPNSGLSDAARLALIDQAIALRGEAQTIGADWGAGGTYRQITTALVAAAGGNVTGSSGAMVQGMVVNYVQQQGAGYIGQLVANGTLIEGSAEHAALHAIVACGGAAAGGSNCASGAGGAAVSSLLTGLFSETSPDETQAQREAKRNLITSLVSGIAATTGADVATATSAGIAATDNNWLASQQIVQAKKELAAAKGPLETMAVMAKWAGVSTKQDALTMNGVAKGLAEAGWTDVKGIASFLANPREGLNGLKELLSNPEAQAQLGASVVNSLEAKIDLMNDALVKGGDENAERLGKELGEVVWQVGSVLTGVGGVATGGMALAKAGVKVGSNTLKAMAATSTAVITELKIASALPGAAKSVEAFSAQTSAGLKSQYAAKPANAYTVQAQAGKGKPVASPQAALEPVTGANTINVSTLSQSTINEVLAIEKGMRPAPSSYLSQAYQDAHAEIFSGGAVRIQPSAPAGTIGRTETWVLPKTTAMDAIAQSSGDVSKLEAFLGLDRGYLGTQPVLVDIPKLSGYRIPSGNEFGANSFWRPGGFTSPGGLPEAVIHPVKPGFYTVSPVFP